MKNINKCLLLTLISTILISFSVNAEDLIDVGLAYGSSAPTTVSVQGNVSTQAEGSPIFNNPVISVERPTTIYISAETVNPQEISPTYVSEYGVYALYTDVIPEGAVASQLTVPAIRVMEGDQLRAIVSFPQGVAFRDDTDGVLEYESREYRGELVLHPSPDGAIVVVNRLDVESYLCGVLPYEMSTGWPLEALKAQAVAARNYVANNVGKHRSNGFDLCNTTHCQVYRGKTGEAEDCTQAVFDTAGVYLYYDGKPAQTFYFSSSGGKTENVKDVWGSSFPYLVSVEDTYEKTEDIPSANWQYALSTAALTEKFSNYKIGTIKDIVITSTTDGGRAKTLSISGSSGVKELKATDFRSLIGVSAIKGTFFTIEKSSDENIAVISASGEKTIGIEMNVICSDAVKTLATPSAFLGKNGVFLFEPTYSSFKFVGKGYGHGVG
ncbi:MAG: SpoIID/LytB domain-containing protein, partial [Clostridia bacterium]|nr:SpoIID/LytB domain-containing protein [Clostridia bacterium]